MGLRARHPTARDLRNNTADAARARNPASPLPPFRAGLRRFPAPDGTPMAPADLREANAMRLTMPYPAIATNVVPVRSARVHARTRRSVLSLARAIEPDACAVLLWYDTVGIGELWDRTARELVEAGQGRRVLGFLAEVASGRRD